jgi:hypothetical protein
MWYLKEQCSPLETLIPGGKVYDEVDHMPVGNSLEVQRTWEALGNMCCTAMDGAP